MDYVALRSLEPEHSPIKGGNHSLVPGYSQERLITVIGSYDKQQVHLQDPGQVQKAARLKIRFLQQPKLNIASRQGGKHTRCLLNTIKFRRLVESNRLGPTVLPQWWGGYGKGRGAGGCGGVLAGHVYA